MTIEKLAFLALKQIIKNENRRGDVLVILLDLGCETSLEDARDVAKYIENRGYGKITWYPKGRAVIDANLNAVDFVNKLSYMTFEQKLKLIYSELEILPNKKGKLEDILDKLGIEHDPHTEMEFVNDFNATGYVKVTDSSKDGYNLVLTQRGQDYLHAPPTQKSTQPNIVIENYQNSNVNKGGIQLGSFESGIKKDSNNATNNPNTNPTPSPSPNSPTRKIQRWQLVVAVIGVTIAFISLCIVIYNFLK